MGATWNSREKSRRSIDRFLSFALPPFVKVVHSENAGAFLA